MKRLVIKDLENNDIIFKSDWIPCDLKDKSIERKIINKGKKALKNYGNECEDEFYYHSYWLIKQPIEL